MDKKFILPPKHTFHQSEICHYDEVHFPDMMILSLTKKPSDKGREPLASQQTTKIQKMYTRT